MRALALNCEGRLPIDDVQRILREVASALAYAHKRGVVHRDVKPANILREAESGRALVSDFGIVHGPGNWLHPWGHEWDPAARQ